MGGLVAAQYLATHGDREKTGRVVMLAPPLMGSEVADALHTLPPYHWLFGPAGQGLTTSARAVAMPSYYELGIIAGTGGGLYPLGRAFIPGPHDGRVAVERTRYPGMADHLVVPTSHSFIMRKPEVHRQVLYFLEHGRFDH
jgi:pimeloyl-ACP methyl ester carboxylesterase